MVNQLFYFGAKVRENVMSGSIWYVPYGIQEGERDLRRKGGKSADPGAR